MIRVACALGTLALIAGIASADYSCRSRVTYYPTYSYPAYSYAAPTYKEEVRIKEVVIPSFVTIPLYGAYYSPPATAPQAAPAAPPAAPAPATPAPAAAPAKAPCHDVNARVDALEGKLNQILRALEETRPPAAPKAPPAKAPEKPKEPPPHPALSILKNRCAACHSPGAAEADHGGLTMFDASGALASLSDRQWGKVGTKLALRSMPPKKDASGKEVPSLTDQEYAAIVDYLDTRK